MTDTRRHPDEASARRSRRSFLRLLLGSPLLLTTPGLMRIANAETAAEQELIAAASEAINVFDLQAVARRNLSEAHFTYLSMGVEDEVTLRANRTAFSDIQLRPRRLVDVRDVDTSLELLGTRLSCPILLARSEVSAPITPMVSSRSHARREGAITCRSCRWDPPSRSARSRRPTASPCGRSSMRTATRG